MSTYGMRVVVMLVVAGALFGVATSMLNHGSGPAAVYASKVLGSGWAWLAAGFGAALTGRGWLAASGHCLAFLVPAVVTYYGADAVSGVYTSPAFDDPTGPVHFDVLSVVAELGFYLVLALIASAALALLVKVIQRGGLLGLLASIVVPGYIAASALHLHQQLLAVRHPPADPAQVVVTWWMGIVALAIAIGVVPARVLADRLAADRQRPRTVQGGSPRA